jgi:hypothetical protein
MAFIKGGAVMVNSILEYIQGELDDTVAIRNMGDQLDSEQLEQIANIVTKALMKYKTENQLSMRDDTPADGNTDFKQLDKHD